MTRPQLLIALSITAVTTWPAASFGESSSLDTRDWMMTLVTETNGGRFGVTRGLTFETCDAMVRNHVEGNAASAEDAERAKALFASNDIASTPPKKDAPAVIRNAACLYAGINPPSAK